MDRRPPAMFVGGVLGLDFLNSIATPVDAVVDWLEDGEGYLIWLEQAQLAPADVLRTPDLRPLAKVCADMSSHLEDSSRVWIAIGHPKTTWWKDPQPPSLINSN